MSTKRSLCSGFALLAFVLVSGCQPTSEERLQRAASYMADNEYRGAVIELKNALRDDEGSAAAREMLARASYQLADYETAEREYRRAIELGAESLPLYVGHGRVLLEMNRTDDALQLVMPKLPAASEDVDAAVLAGDILAVSGQIDAAEDRYLSVLAVDPQNVESKVGMADVLVRHGDVAGARDSLVSATEEVPTSVAAWRAMGDFLLFQRDVPGAIQAYDTSIANEAASTPYAHVFLNRVSVVNAHLSAKDFDGAERRVTELEKLIPDHTIIHYLRGRISYGQEDFDTAQKELLEYLSYIPDDMQGQAVLGAVNFSQNYLRQAEMYLSRAVREQVGGDMTRRLLAETQLRLDKPADALQSLAALEGEHTDDPVLLTMLGRAELGLGNSAAAVDYLERSVAADPDNPDTNISLAAVLLASGDYTRVIKLLDALPQQPDGGYRRESLLIAAHLKNDDQPAAIRESESLIRNNPTDPVAYAVAGNLQQSIGDATTAKTMFGRALALDAKSIPALYGLGRLALLDDDADEAERQFTAAVKADSKFLPALAALAELLSDQGRYGDITSRLEAAVRADPGALGPRLLYASTALANDHAEEVLDMVVAARELHPGEPRLDHAEGMARIALGQTQVGLRNLELAADALPKDARIQYDAAREQLLNSSFRNAIKYIGNYRILRPDNISGLAIQVEALARSGDTAAARTTLDDFKGVNNVQPLTEILAGDIEMIDDNPEAAVDHYEDAASGFWNRLIVTRLVQAYQNVDPQKAAAPIERWLADNPDDSEMRRMLGQIQDAAGNTAAAVANYESVLEKNGDDPVALNNLAWQYAMEGRDGAIGLAERAHELAPDNGSISDTLGWILHLAGKHDRAEGILRRAIAQAPENAEIKYHLAAVLVARGAKGEAGNLLRNTLREHPLFPSRTEAEALLEKI